jgi:hypothetical protein
MTLNTRLYLSASDHGPVLAVACSAQWHQSRWPGSQRFPAAQLHVDAFKNWFPQQVRGKDAIARLTLVGDKTLNGNLGREYRLVIGDLSGTARVFATKRRFYAAVVLNTKKNDELTDQFLSSFILPEKIAPTAPVSPNPPAELAADRKAGPNKEKENGDGAAQKTDAPDAAVAGGEAKAGDAPATATTKPGEKKRLSRGGCSMARRSSCRNRNIRPSRRKPRLPVL